MQDLFHTLLFYALLFMRFIYVRGAEKMGLFYCVSFGYNTNITSGGRIEKCGRLTTGPAFAAGKERGKNEESCFK